MIEPVEPEEPEEPVEHVEPVEPEEPEEPVKPKPKRTAKKNIIVEDIKPQIVNQQVILRLISQNHYHLNLIHAFILMISHAVIHGQVLKTLTINYIYIFQRMIMLIINTVL